MMKLAIVKQKYIPGYTWKSHRWDNPKSMLNDFMLRSKNFSLLFETKGDVWVVDDSHYESDTYRTMKQKRPMELKELCDSQESVPWGDVPWQDYDVVITLDPIAPKSLIEMYENVLWCYYCAEHSSKVWNKSLKKPVQKYDLFLDHVLQTEIKPVNKLPLAVRFPAVVSRMAFRETLDLRKKYDRVFLDSHAIRKITDFESFDTDMFKQFGIEADYPKPWKFSESYAAVAQKQMLSTKDYLQRVAYSKYFYLCRRASGNGFVGQAAPEAAGLGCVVIADESCVYAKRLCHPLTLIENGDDYDTASLVIQSIQDNNDLYKEVIAYQNERLNRIFNREPIELLERYSRIKKGA